MLNSQYYCFYNLIAVCILASVRDCAIGGSLHGALPSLRTAGIVRVLNKFCTRSERIIQNISDIIILILLRFQSFLCMELQDYYLEENEKNIFFITYFQVC